jgi:ankyrin repeat protein
MDNASTTSDTTEPPRLSAAALWWILGGTAVMLGLTGVILAIWVRGGMWGVKTDSLHTAAIHFPEYIPTLARAGHEVNALVGAETPLSQAVTFRKVESVRLLLAHGADPNLCGPGGKPPLASPFLHYNTPDALRIVGMLLEAGADPNVHGTFEKTPLHQAAETGNLPLVRALMDAGADVNAASDMGSPLHSAVQGGNVLIVEELLRAGADPDVKDRVQNRPDVGAKPEIRDVFQRYREAAAAEDVKGD